MNCYSREAVQQAVERKGYKYFVNGAYNVNIVGIRNSSTNNQVTDKFDDCITLSYKGDDGEWRMHCYKATTDPGKYWTENLMNSSGVAILKPGQYRGAYKIRKHRRKYYALCQRGPVTVYRDRNKDDVYDMVEEYARRGVYGINIHKAGSWKNGSKIVDKWSAGCQVFSTESDFNEFMSVMYIARDRWSDSFSYTLLDSNDIYNDISSRI